MSQSDQDCSFNKVVSHPLACKEEHLCTPITHQASTRSTSTAATQTIVVGESPTIPFNLAQARRESFFASGGGSQINKISVNSNAPNQPY